MRKWIADRIKEIGTSQTKVAKELGLTQSRVAEMVAGRRQLKSTEIVNFARALDIPEEHANTFFQTGELAVKGNTSPIPVQQIRVEGTSQAGIFRDISLIEDDEHEREYVPGSIDPRCPHAHHYALNVAGDSMNNLFKDGSQVVCAAWGDLGIDVKQGHILHIERRRFASEIETTLKVYNERDGKRWLDPNSTNEKHKSIEINGNEDTEIIIKGLVLYELNKMSY